jgi:uncharacterized protein YaaR (DUF327 family)
MENSVKPQNGHDEWLAMENAKKDYMEKCWNMSHAQLFSELMRVHTESAKMMQVAQEKIQELMDEIEDDGK